MTFTCRGPKESSWSRDRIRAARRHLPELSANASISRRSAVRYLPGRAKLTLPDQIYTHFERQETLSTLHGKLEDELVRIHDILSRATAASLIIMNESFSSTTVNDALLIGTEILKRIIKLRCIAIYVSFLDELASLDQACVSMVGEVAPDDPSQRTFKFTRRPADGLAYAAALADKYGLSHDILRRRISSMKVRLLHPERRRRPAAPVALADKRPHQRRLGTRPGSTMPWPPATLFCSTPPKRSFRSP